MATTSRAIALSAADVLTVTNNQIRTTSLAVANAFGKQHKNVIQKLESLDCSAGFTSANFSAHEKLIQAGAVKRKSKVYEMTKDGFMFLVMGFTGKKAAGIKEAYINAFNQMAEQLQQQGAPATGITRAIYMGQPVATFEMIDKAHGRKEGHTSKSFYRDLSRGLLKSGVDFFKVALSDHEKLEAVAVLNRRGLIVLTASGYKQVAGHFSEPGAEATRQKMLNEYYGSAKGFDGVDNNQVAVMREATRLLGCWVDIQNVADGAERLVQLYHWETQVFELAKNASGDFAASTRQAEAEELLVKRLQLMRDPDADDETYIQNMMQHNLKEVVWAKRHRLLASQQ